MFDLPSWSAFLGQQDKASAEGGGGSLFFQRGRGILEISLIAEKVFFYNRTPLKFIFRSHTQRKTFSDRTHDQNYFRVVHMTTKNILWGRTQDQYLSQVEHTTKIFLKSASVPFVNLIEAYQWNTNSKIFFRRMTAVLTVKSQRKCIWFPRFSLLAFTRPYGARETGRRARENLGTKFCQTKPVRYKLVCEQNVFCYPNPFNLLF